MCEEGIRRIDRYTNNENTVAGLRSRVFYAFQTRITEIRYLCVIWIKLNENGSAL